MEKVAQDEIKSKLNEIEAALNDGDHTLDEKIKTVNLNLESVKNGMTDQIEQVNVSLKIIHGKDRRERSRWAISDGEIMFENSPERPELADS